MHLTTFATVAAAASFAAAAHAGLSVQASTIGGVDQQTSDTAASLTASSSDLRMESITGFWNYSEDQDASAFVTYGSGFVYGFSEQSVAIASENRIASFGRRNRSASANASFSDVLTVESLSGSSGVLAVTVTMEVSDSVANAPGSGITAQNPANFLGSQAPIAGIGFRGNSQPSGDFGRTTTDPSNFRDGLNIVSGTDSFTFLINDGGSFDLFASIQSVAQSSITGVDGENFSADPAYLGFRVFIDVEDRSQVPTGPAGSSTSTDFAFSLTSESGHDYTMVPAFPVPAPAAALVLGASLLNARRRR
ncbi:MAG: hypothetical protein AAGB51_13850 [Planctomycetota bacterium]